MKINIISVSYNDLEGLKDTIESVDSQTYLDVQHIVIDGGTSNFNEILSISRVKDFVYVSEPDNGIYDAMNKGLSYCSEGIVCWLNSADVYESENTLTWVNEAFTKNEWLWCYGAMDFIHLPGTKKTIHWQYPFNLRLLAFGFRWIPHPSTFYQMQLISQIQKYDLMIDVASDQDFILRASKISLPGYLPFVCVTMKPGGIHTSLKGLDRERTWQEIRRKNGLLLFDSVWADNVYIALSPVVSRIFYLYRDTLNHLVIKHILNSK